MGDSKLWYCVGCRKVGYVRVADVAVGLNELERAKKTHQNVSRFCVGKDEAVTIVPDWLRHGIRDR